MVSRSARRRQLARESYERYQARRQEKEQRVRRNRRIAVVGGLVAVLVVAVGLGVWWFLDVGEDELTVASDATATAAPGTCAFTPGGSAAGTVTGVPPAEPGDLSGTWTATFTIGGQPVTASLDAAAAPCAVSSLQFLADQGYYTATPCHRLTTGAAFKVLQCGDPTGTGSGTPGYSFGTENTEGATYPAGTLAMANAAGANGSQFFIVYGDTQLSPDYTVLGTVTSGLEVVQAIGAAGVAGGAEDGSPSQTVILDSVSVTRA